MLPLICISDLIEFNCECLGHSDVVGGAIITSSDDLHDRLRFLQNGEQIESVQLIPNITSSIQSS